jgi:GTP cyclohydrolase I
VSARASAPDQPRAEQAVRDLLGALGLDPDHPALEETPRRTAEAFLGVLTGGYAEDPLAALGKGFPAKSRTPLVAIDVPLMFTCPHHLMPARGRAHVALLPRDRVPGLSRIARLVDVLGHRLVLQEDLTADIVEALQAGLGVLAAVAVVEARHTCVAIEDLARCETVFRTRARAGSAASCASLEAEIDASLRSPWPTSASEPTAAPRASRSRSRSAPAPAAPRRPRTGSSR